MSSQLLASKIVIQEEAPQVRTITGVQTNVTGFGGVTEKGPVGVATLVTSPDDYDRIFGGYVANGFVRQAVDGFFQNSGGTGQIYIVRTVHYTDVTDPSTKTSAAATAMLQTGATGASSGKTVSSNAAPFNCEPGDTLKVVTDANGAGVVATFTATAAARECATAETYNLTDGWTLLVKVDNEAVAQTIIFHTADFVSIAAATAEEVAAAINKGIARASSTATTGGTKVTITSDTRGSGSHIQVTGGTANGALGFNTTAVNGTGNVANIDAVTAAEVKAVVEAAVTGVTVTGSSLITITRNTTGTGSTVAVDVTSTLDTVMGFDNAVHSGTTGAAVNTLQVNAKYDGTFGNALKALIATATSGEVARFNLQVLKSGLVVETWPNLTMDSTDDRYAPTIINANNTGSKYISVVDEVAATGSAAGDRPINVTSPFLTGGNDGLAGLTDTDFTGATSSNGKTGLRCFDLAHELNLLAVPGRATSAVHNAMITYCEVTRQGAVFAILDAPAGDSATDVIAYFGATAGVLGLSEYAAAYWPQVKVLNPNTAVFGKTADNTITVPPSGHIAGVYARNDNATLGGVYVPPAGVENGVLFGVLGFDTTDCLEEEKNDLVFPQRINPLTRLKNGPRFIDGARTLKSNGNFPSVPERRGAIFIEQSIKDGLQFARQKNNDENLRSAVARTCDDFLRRQMKNGAFRSTDPATAYFVDFGDALNPVSVQFAGQLVGRIGIATKKIAEYIVLRFSQDTRALDEQAAA